MAIIPITKEEIKKINELYYKLGSYAAVARETGRSAATIKKYVDKNYKPIDENKIIRFLLEDLPTKFDYSMFDGLDNFGDLCILSEEEKEAIEILHGEMEL